MARKPKIKQLDGTKLLKEYASWVYCNSCEKTAAYLCYVTYDLCELDFTCNCGNNGRLFIEFEHDAAMVSDEPLNAVKNRLCCPKDHSPLLTMVEKNLTNYSVRIVCNTCGTEYSQTKSGD